MLKTALLIAGLAIAQLPAEKPPQAQPPAPKPAPTTPATPAPKPAAPAAAAAAPRQNVTARSAITITVTDRQGRPLSNVTVRATGPTEREGTSDAEGNATLRNAAPGTYRLRFDHESHISFEKEVTVMPGRPARTTAELTAAPPPPPPPPPPQPEPAAAPPPQSSSDTGPSGSPSSLDLINFWEKNSLPRGTPFKSSQIGCSGTATGSLLQFRGTVAEHTHSDSDEMLYVMAGDGTMRVGGLDVPLPHNTFAVIPKGTPHTFTHRNGSLMLAISILSGAPCTSPGK